MRMDLRDSLQLILRRKHELVTDFFYEVFLGKYPQVQHYFRDVDMGRQALLLTMALQTIVDLRVHQYPVTQRYLEHLGRQHRHLGIPRELYATWKDAMMETLADFHGDQWSDELSKQWSDAIAGATAVMIGAYGDDDV
jgi:hemoglobin-like flavoprotein